MKSASVLISIAIFTGATGAWPPNNGHGPPGYRPPPFSSPQSWGLKEFTSLVVLGDSYSDDSRLDYFIEHDGQAPPVGWVDPVNFDAADGGRVWPEYVKQYAGVNLYNYAVSGAVCSNNITPRFLSSIDGPFPAVEQYEVPAYIADAKFVEPNGTKFMSDPVASTVYAIWIGTNDLGDGALLTDSQVAGTNITTYMDCVYEQLRRVYDNGARYFVVMNVAPLNLAPLYGLPGQGGVGPNQYWMDKPANLTAISYRMLEQVATVNSIYEYRTPFEVELARQYPGADFAVFDVHGLMTDIHDHPAMYLNGTAPLNVTGFIHHCNITGGDCVTSESPDSFLWFDELHPSEQTERVIARTFVDVVKGASQWATYWSS